MLGDRDLGRSLLRPLAEIQLAALRVDQPSLRLRAEQLALEPLKLTRQLRIAGGERVD